MNSPPGKKKRPINRSHSKKKHPAKTTDGNIMPFLKRRNENSEESSSIKKIRYTKSPSPMTEIGNHRTRETLPSSEESVDEEREFTVNLGDGGKEHVVKGSIQDNVLEALRATKEVIARMDKEEGKGKQIYLIGKKGIEGSINLGMPLRYLPDGCQFEMKFFRGRQNGSTGELGYRQYGNKKKLCILFYVSPSGNRMETNGALSRRVIRCNQLLNERCRLCVFAPKGETIKDALCKDGRFIPELEEKDWVLMEGKRSIENTHSVNTLSGKAFEVEVKTARRAKSGGGQNNEQIPQTSHKRELNPSHYFKSGLLDLYPDLKEQSDIINNFFANVPKHGTNKNVLGVYKEAFGKEIKDSIPIKMLKIQSSNSDSVGYIEWGINEKQGVATCFLLCDRYILTCHHVIKFIVGEGVGENEWACKISKLARVTFSYEDKHPKENDWFCLEEWFEISDVALDFAVLKLKERGNERRLPAGLVHLSSPPPFNGLTYIIGHPDGETKSIDGCSVVDIFKRQRECTHRTLTECNNFNCGYDRKDIKCIHLFNPREFEIINNHHVVTYDTSFYKGSSGSPVFDKDGNLVAMHTAGYHYGETKKGSIIEFGYLMTSILSVIKEKWNIFYDSEIVPALRDGNLNSKIVPAVGDGNLNSDLPMDVEMVPVD